MSDFGHGALMVGVFGWVGLVLVIWTASRRLSEHEADLQYARQQAAERKARIAELEARNAELERQADQRWEADQRAIARWHDAGHDRLAWPDHADLCVWLLEQVEAERPLMDVTLRTQRDEARRDAAHWQQEAQAWEEGFDDMRRQRDRFYTEIEDARHRLLQLVGADDLRQAGGEDRITTHTAWGMDGELGVREYDGPAQHAPLCVVVDLLVREWHMAYVER